MGSKLELALLGPPRVTLDGEPVTIFRTAKAQALLYYLAVTGLPHSRSVLAGLLWGDMPEANARRNLTKSLSELRQVVGDHIRIGSGEVEFDRSSDHWLDVTCLQASIKQVQRGAGGVDLEQMAELVRGDFLHGFDVHNAPDFEAWVLAARTQYRRQIIELFEALATSCQAAGDLSQAMLFTRQILDLEPWREEAHRRLMRLLAEDGQRSAALVQFEICRQALDEELGVTPTEATESLVQAIRDGTVVDPQGSDQSTQSTAFNKGAALEHYLQVQTTPFIGRVPELAAILRRLHDPTCRLLTLAGPGGIGKTRLALEAVRLIRRHTSPADLFQDGIFFVPLATVQSPQGMVAAMSQALGVRLHDREKPTQELLDFLKDKRLLLLLDNFEHLQSDAALIADVLAAAQSVKVLVTSRIALNLHEEWFHVVAGLSLPPPPDVKRTSGPASVAQSDAVRLFEQSARRSVVDFSSMKERQYVVQICRLVEGMPLAIELAAAWLKVLPAREVADAIARDLDMLVSRNRNMIERHRSMRVVLDHTWRLLSGEEKNVFRRLAIFRGGFDQEAATAVASASLPTLASLVEHCLLRTTADGRYVVHELLRQYAMERLRSRDEDYVRQLERHSNYFAEFAYDRSGQIDASDRQLAVLDEIAIEWENLSAAWSWSTQSVNVDNIGKMVGVVGSYALYRSRLLEGAEMLQKGAKSLHNAGSSLANEAVYANLLTLQGWLYIRLGQTQEAEDAFAHSQDLYERLGIPFAPTVATDPKLGLGVVANVRGHYAEAEVHGEASLRQSAARRDKKNLLYAAYILANAAYAQGDYRKAQGLAQQTYTLSKEVKQNVDMCYFLDHLGEIASALGEYEQAQGYYRDCYALQEKLDNPEGMAEALNHQGEAVFAQGRIEEAERMFQQALTICRNVGNRGGIATSIKDLGSVASARGDYRRALTQFAIALEICAEIDYVPLMLAIFAEGGKALFCLERAAEGASLLRLVARHPASQRPTRDRAESLLCQHSDVITVAGTALDGPGNSDELADTSHKFIELVKQIDGKT